MESSQEMESRLIREPKIDNFKTRSHIKIPELNLRRSEIHRKDNQQKMPSNIVNAQLKARLDDEKIRNFYSSREWTDDEPFTNGPTLSQKSVRFTPQMNNRDFEPKNSGVLKNVKRLYPNRQYKEKQQLSTQEEAREQYQRIAKQQQDSHRNKRVRRLDSTFKLSSMMVAHKDLPSKELEEQLPDWEDIQDTMTLPSDPRRLYAYKEEIKRSAIIPFTNEPDDIDELG